MNRDRGPDIRVPPPFIFIAGFLIGVALDRAVASLPFVQESAAARVLAIVGGTTAALGILISTWGAFTFGRAGTAVLPMHPASRLVQHGPYRFTRNPMYVGLTLFYVGAALATNMIWPLVALPLVLWVLTTQVVRREERYLAGAFGDAYADYKRRVRRWI